MCTGTKNANDNYSWSQDDSGNKKRGVNDTASYFTKVHWNFVKMKKKLTHNFHLALNHTKLVTDSRDFLSVIGENKLLYTFFTSRK